MRTTRLELSIFDENGSIHQHRRLEAGFRWGDELELRHDVETILKYLDPASRDLIELRFGLLDGKTRTLREIARIVGISPECARNRVSASLGCLRALMEGN